MEALEKFDDKAGRAMRQTEKTMVQIKRAHKQIEMTHMKDVSVTRKLLEAVDASGLTPHAGGGKKGKNVARRRTSWSVRPQPPCRYT